MKIERIFEMPNTSTFEMLKLRKWLIEWCNGKILNVFGGKTKLVIPNCEIIHNDINKNIESDTYIDALFIDKFFEHNTFNTIILDPPYTFFQTIHYYEGFRCQDITRVRNAVDKLLKKNGIVISLGYNSTGMNNKRGYKKLAILLVNCGGSHNDIIVLVERKEGINYYEK